MSRIALVTGASRGIGRAIALDLASHELTVWIGFLQRCAEAEKTCEMIRDRGGNAELCQFDVANPAGYSELERRLLGDVNLVAVVHSAGVVHRAMMLQTSPNDWARVMATNLNGFHLLCRAVLKPMIRRRSGSIVAIGSVISRGGQAGSSAYVASKAGLVGAARSLAREVGPFNIRVNVIEPGWIETDMTADAPAKDVVPLIPMRRVGKPDDIAGLVSFLSSPKASYITGAVIPVSGGLDM